MTTITLISGADQGIGLAAATQLAKDHGHHVIVGSRSAEQGAKVAASLIAEGFAVSTVQLDLTSDNSIRAACASIEKDFGRLDVLINNAGILIDHKMAGDNRRDLFTETFSTNVIGTACLTETLLPLLRNSSAPRLVFVSSVMGSLTRATDRSTMYYAADYKAYDASKAAVNMLALNYSRILEDTGARVNVVCPGLVSTNLTNYSVYGTTTTIGATRLVEMATVAKDGPMETFSDRQGQIPW